MAYMIHRHVRSRDHLSVGCTFNILRALKALTHLRYSYITQFSYTTPFWPSTDNNSLGLVIKHWGI